MAANRGIVVPLEGVTITAEALPSSEAVSSAGRHAGAAVRLAGDGDRVMGIRALRRTPDIVEEDDDGVLVRTVQGGLPMPVPGYPGTPAGFLWAHGAAEDLASPDGPWMGWNDPRRCGRWEWATTDLTLQVKGLDAVRWGDRLAIVAQVGGRWDLILRDADGAETHTTPCLSAPISEIATTDADIRHACVVVVRDRLHVYWWSNTRSSTGARSWQIAGAFTEDGSTWFLLGHVSDDLVEDGSGFDVDRIRAAAIDDHVTIVGNYKDNSRSNDKYPCVQWDSEDGGHTFHYAGVVSTDHASTASADGYYRPDITADGHAFLVAFCHLDGAAEATSAAGYVKIARMAPGETIADVVAGAVPAHGFDGQIADPTPYDGALCRDEGGTVFVFARNLSDISRTGSFDADERVRWSFDGGLTFAEGRRAYALLYSGSPEWMVIAPWVGGGPTALYAITGFTGTVDEVGRVALERWGGYTPAPLPSSVRGDLLGTVLTPKRWPALGDIASYGWTETDTGIVTASDASGYLRVTSASSGQRRWTEVITGNQIDIDNGGVYLHLRFRIHGGNVLDPTSSFACGVVVGVFATSGDPGVQVKVTRSQLILSDGSTTTTVDLWRDGSSYAPGVVSTPWIDMVIGIRDEVCKVHLWSGDGSRTSTYSASAGRPVAQPLYVTAEKAFTGGGTNTTIDIDTEVDNNGGSTGQRVTWGFIQWAVDNSGEDVGSAMSRFMDADPLEGGYGGRPFSVHTVEVTPEHHLRADGNGTTRQGDAWHLPVSYDYPLQAALDPSPRRVWKEGDYPSANGWGDTHAFKVTWDSDVLPSEVLAVYLDGNVGQFNLYVGSSGATPIPCGSPLGGMLSVAEHSKGAIAQGSGDVIQRDELVGGTYHPRVGTGASDAERVGVRIAHNSAHTPGGDADPVQLRLLTDETPAATSSASDARIYPPAILVLVSLRGVTADELWIEVPDQADADTPRPPGDQHQIRVLMVGAFLPFPESYGWGRVVQVEANTELSRARDGSRRSVRRGPPRRSVDLAWPDGVDALNAWLGEHEPEDVTWDDHASAYPSVHRGGTPAEVDAIVRYCDGPDKPVVYVADAGVPGSSTGVSFVTRRSLLVYGRLDDRVRFESVQGDETDGEVWRIGTVTITEEV